MPGPLWHSERVDTWVDIPAEGVRTLYGFCARMGVKVEGTGSRIRFAWITQIFGKQAETSSRPWTCACVHEGGLKLGQGFRNFLRCLTGAIVFVGGFSLAGSLAARQENAAWATASKLSGFWVRMDEQGSGSFDGMMAAIPKATLTAEEIQATRKEKAARAQDESVVDFISKWCLKRPYPFMMQHSAPIDIVETPGEIAVVPESNADARHIYMDGRDHSAPLIPSGTGHSIGHWEGKTLIVDSVGFKGGMAIPGGGRVTPNSHLVERYFLSKDGQSLSITFTWDDPTVFLKPHTYHFTYQRMKTDTYALEEFCDASRPEQSGSVVEPPQN